MAFWTWVYLRVATHPKKWVDHVLSSVEHNLLVLFVCLSCLVLLCFVMLCFIMLCYVCLVVCFFGFNMLPLLEVFFGGIDSGILAVPSVYGLWRCQWGDNLENHLLTVSLKPKFSVKRRTVLDPMLQMLEKIQSWTNKTQDQKWSKKLQSQIPKRCSSNG